MEVQWKALLVWTVVGEDDQREDSQKTELNSYFLGDKKFFYRRGNVESHHLEGADRSSGPDRRAGPRWGVWHRALEVDPG